MMKRLQYCPKHYCDVLVVACWEDTPTNFPAVLCEDGRFGWVFPEDRHHTLWDMDKLRVSDSLQKVARGNKCPDWVHPDFEVVMNNTKPYRFPRRRNKSTIVNDCKCNAINFLSFGHDKDCPYYKPPSISKYL